MVELRLIKETQPHLLGSDRLLTPPEDTFGVGGSKLPRTARHDHSSTDSLPHHQHSVDSSMDSVRPMRSPTGTSCTLGPQAKVAAHQHQQSSSSRPPQSSGLLTQLLVTAVIVADQDQKPSPSDARGSRLHESAPTRAARSEFPPGPTTTIGSSCRGVQTAPDGAASAPTRLVAHPSLTKPHLSATIDSRIYTSNWRAGMGCCDRYRGYTW